MHNRVFFPQACLDQWGIEGKIELSEADLVVVAEGRRYSMVEVVRVVAEVTGGVDPHAIVGKVKSKVELEKLGAEILEGSMILGDNAYDVVPGWAGTPTSSFAEHLASSERADARKASGHAEPEVAPKTEEEMLERFVGSTL